MYSKLIRQAHRTSYIVHRTLFIILCIMASLRASSQYTIERIDSTHYRFCTASSDGRGGVSVTCSAPTSRDTAIGYLGALADRQRAYILAKPWEADWNAIDSAIKKYTGSTYDQHMRANAAASLAGDWMVITVPSTGSASTSSSGGGTRAEKGDTINIKLTKSTANINILKISGGTIHGECELVDDRSIRITGVLPGPVTLSMEKGRGLVGKYGGREVVMRK